MNDDPAPATRLPYSSVPANSLARYEQRPDGSVTIFIPPVLHRTIGLLGLIGSGITTFAPAAAVIKAWWPESVPARGIMLAVLGGIFPLGLFSFILWGGLRETIIHAGDDGLRMELNGRFLKRQVYWPRERIGGFRQGIGVCVLSPEGRTIGRISVSDSKEERWIMSVMRTALKLPPG